MTTYVVKFRPRAARQIAKLESRIRESVLRKAYALALDPRPHGSQKLYGEPACYRVRVGAYRIIYEIDDDVRRVEVGTVGHRREVYR
jgi:mRNA interferase RelE/StbE